MRNSVVAIGLWCALQAFTVQAGFEEGVAAARKGDFAEALREWKALADQGHGAAQYNLGLLYDKGRGVPQDYAQAEAWYRKAADQGFIWAQFALGSMYEKGQGVTQNYQEALTWYGKAADNGFAKAQLVLAGMVEKGQGVPASRVMAYALSNFATLSDSSKTNPALQARDRLAKSLSQQELDAGQKLMLELAKPGQLLQVMFSYREPAR